MGWEVAITQVIVVRMEQDPEYLKNQSRHHHARYRSKRAMINVFTAIWLFVFLSLFCGALLDWLIKAQWGLADQMLEFLAFGAFGVLVWLIQTLIAKLVLAYVRHTYGPDPSD